MKRQKVVKKLKKKMTNANVYRYMAVFEPNEQGGFNVSFPAIPGCVTFGTSLADAKRMAKDALALWIEELLSEKEELPKEEGDPRFERIEVAVAKP